MNKKFILASIDILLFVILSMILDIFLFTIYGYKKMLFLVIGVQIVIWLISLITYFSRKNLIYNTGIFITFLVNVISCYYIYSYNNSYDLVGGLIFNKYKYVDYELYVKKGTTYSNIKELKDKNVGLLDDNYDNVCKALNEDIKVTCKKYYYFDQLIDGLNNADVQGILVDNLDGDDTIISSDYRKIDNIRVKYEK